MLPQLRNLVAIHGSEPAAQHAFERCCEMLVRGEFTDAHGVRPTQGDGGIDVYVGDLTDPAGVHVFQARFYPDGVTTRTRKVEQAFERAMTSGRAVVRHWTLCVPSNFGDAEERWWRTWRADAQQRYPGVTVDRWDGGHLERLLLEERHLEVRRAVFRIRETPLAERDEQLHLTEMGRIDRATLGQLRRRSAARTGAAAVGCALGLHGAGLLMTPAASAQLNFWALGGALLCLGVAWFAGWRTYGRLMGDWRTLFNQLPAEYAPESLAVVNAKNGTPLVRRGADGGMDVALAQHRCVHYPCPGVVTATWGTRSGRGGPSLGNLAATVAAGDVGGPPPEEPQFVGVCSVESRYHRYLVMGDLAQGGLFTRPIAPT